MELAANSTTPRITQEELNYVNPNLTNSPVTPNAILTGSNKRPVLKDSLHAIAV